MSRNKNFLKNTLIIMIGKFSTQFVSFLLIPLYTNFFIAKDYGYADLIQTYILLFVPIITLRIDSATFRFLIDCRKNEKEKNKMINNILFVLAICVLIVTVICVPLFLLMHMKYATEALLNVIVLMISNVIIQILRGVGKTKEYSIYSIICALCTLLINVVLIVIFNFKSNSIFISSTVANLISITYAMFILRNNLDIKNKHDKKTIKEILKYSIPMIPNTLSWWIVNVSDRTIITICIGAAANAIYSVSCKLSNILSSVFTIFNMSWQETASLHINDEDKDEFFSQMINILLFFFASIALLIIGVLPFIFNIIIGKNYLSAYQYIPIVLYGNIWDIIICLIGGIYVAKKKTKEIAITTILSASINLILNLFFIKIIGLYAACISTVVAYVVLGIYRCKDCQKYVKLKIDFKKLAVLTFLFFISSMLYLSKNIYLEVINITIVVLYFILLNKKVFKKIYLVIKKK